MYTRRRKSACARTHTHFVVTGVMLIWGRVVKPDHTPYARQFDTRVALQASISRPSSREWAPDSTEDGEGKGVTYRRQVPPSHKAGLEADFFFFSLVNVSVKGKTFKHYEGLIKLMWSLAP